MEGDRLIVVSAVVSFTTIGLAELEVTGSLPDTRQWLGIMIAYLILSVLADFGLPIAGGFATLTMVAVLLSRGQDALAFTTGKVKRRRARARPGARRGTIPRATPTIRA